MARRNATPTIVTPVADGVTMFSVSDMRFLPAKGKVAERNPERLGAVHGSSFRHVLGWDADGNAVLGDELSIRTKAIDREDATSANFALDLASGTLTLPAGQRGKPRADGATQDEINALLAAARESI